MIAGQVHQLEAISENLANSNMPGYRKLNVDHKIFDLIYRQAMADPINPSWKEGEQYDPIAIDFTSGALKNTDRPLDFALHGEGFFVLEKDGKEYYTRNGSFKLDDQGRLVNFGDMTVKGSNGEITMPAKINLSEVTVSADGTLKAGARVLGTLQTASFSDLTKLVRVGPTLFAAPKGMSPEATPPETTVMGRTLEDSNTTVFAEMADMISCMRGFEACQRMIRSQDENQGKLIQQLT
jgi:flagellar basal-body rod protein FlgF